MKNVMLFLLLFLMGHVSAQIRTIEATVYFDSDSDQIQDAFKRELLDMLDDVPQGEPFWVDIVGHTDNIGDYRYNMNLSKKRVDAVSYFFQGFGVSEESIKSDYVGYTKPAASNENETHRSKNRRVEVSIRYLYFESTDELDAYLREKHRVKTTFSNQVGDVIDLPMGSRVRVPSNAFVDENGEVVQGNIRFYVSEAIDYGGMMTHNLSTLSSDAVLETGGMIYMEASDEEGNDVYLDKDIQISIPSDEADDQMTVFVSESGSDWTDTEQPVISDFAFEFEEEHPKLDYHFYQQIPKFKYDGPEKPTAPVKVRRPMEPKKPTYNPPRISWYTINKSAKMERAEMEHKKSVDRYDRNFVRYVERLRAYENHEIVFPKLMRKYKEDLAAYQQQRKQDSLDHFQSEEVSDIFRINRIRRDSAYSIYREQVNLYKERKKEAYLKHVAYYDSLGIDVTDDFARNFVMNVSTMGWINVDKFYNVDNSEMMFVEIDKVEEGAKVQLLFKDINSAMSFRFGDQGKCFSPRFPKDESVELFSYKVVDGKIYATKEMVKSSKISGLNYRQVSLEELANMLDNA